ncbi:MFS transporter [Brackiella oedipodis]|uniref:MFS transporter n=1 Tax=Brackiella oedipodis TaxID=124225 RepID=UPI0004907022|nr:MFS transporter [Brackiella oedipodis]
MATHVHQDSQSASRSSRKPRLKLTTQERQAGLSLAFLFAVRMLGLFLLTPVFAEAAHILRGGQDPFLIGLAIGAYGLTQAIMQIPMGMASDRFGRKAIVVIGMLLFIVGGVICALSASVHWVIVGRAIQGFGAVSAAITAWIADSTRPEVRSRVMAMAGVSIGISFAASLVLSPLIVRWAGLTGLFWAISGIGVICLLIAAFRVPSQAIQGRAMGNTKAAEVLKNTNLLRLNMGVFSLHFGMMAMFVVLPSIITHLSHLGTGDLWKIYLPVMLLAFILMVPVIFFIETRYLHRQGLLGSVALLIVVLALMPFFSQHLSALIVCLVLYFVAFNVLEALQPSMVSRACPPEHKGLALGFFNMAQALGVAAGGAMGGLMAARFEVHYVFGLAAVVALLWFIIAFNIKNVVNS